MFKQAADELSNPLGEKFDSYIDALVATNRAADVKPLMDLFAPIWQHNLGYGRLGTAAFKIREYDLAEEYFLKLRNGLDDYCRSEQMSHLAEIWVQKGKGADAQNLLVDCLQKLVMRVSESEYPSDQELYEKEFQFHRTSFLRLFPELHEGELARRRIPSTTMPKSGTA